MVLLGRMLGIGDSELLEQFGLVWVVQVRDDFVLMCMLVGRELVARSLLGMR